jgi:hypothetical protein
MKNTLAKVISALMITIALLGFTGVLQFAHAITTATVYVDPASNIFTGLTIGSTFAVNVSIANTTGIAGVGFTLNYNSTLLNIVSDSEVLYHDAYITPPAYTGNIQQYADAYDNGAGNFNYSYTYLNLGTAYSNGYMPINITTTGSAWNNSAYSWPNGAHGIATVVFKVMTVPGPSSFVTCPLNLTNVVIGDKDANTILTTNVDGVYTDNWAPPPLPHFQVQFPLYTATSLGQVFNVSVLVVGMDPGWQAIGFEFKLSYNASLLNVQNMYEGPWLPPFGSPPNQGTSFLTFQGANYVDIGDVVLPDVNGTWHAPFPAGTGIMATIQFNATAIGVFPNILTCPLTLYGTIVGDIHANTVNQTASVSSVYQIQPPFPVSGRIIDVYTQWPYPYGGQGPNNPSDMFWPQKMVCLYANVSYNGWPEQQKDVAFSIMAPNGTVWGIIYGRTDAYGTVKVSFRLPWPCDNPEQWFGVWTVTATVDIASTIVNDTVQFHYDYLVHIFKETVDINPPSGYNHEQTAGGGAGTPTFIITVNVTFGTYLWQDSIHYVDQSNNVTFDLSNFTLTVTALDNLSVPFGYTYLQVPIAALSNNLPWHFCEQRNITESVTIPVPKWAAAGPGTVYEAILSNWPFLGGTVISAYFDPISGTWMPEAPTPILINAV